MKSLAAWPVRNSAGFGANSLGCHVSAQHAVRFLLSWDASSLAQASITLACLLPQHLPGDVLKLLEKDYVRQVLYWLD